MDKSGKRSLFDQITEEIYLQNQKLAELMQGGGQQPKPYFCSIDIQSAKAYLLSVAADLQIAFQNYTGKQ